jgi:hypothetical protein
MPHAILNDEGSCSKAHAWHETHGHLHRFFPHLMDKEAPDMEQYAPFLLYSKGACQMVRRVVGGAAVARHVLVKSPGSGVHAISMHGFCARTAFWSFLRESRHDN